MLAIESDLVPHTLPHPKHFTFSVALQVFILTLNLYLIPLFPYHHVQPLL